MTEPNNEVLLLCEFFINEEITISSVTRMASIKLHPTHNYIVCNILEGKLTRG